MHSFVPQGVCIVMKLKNCVIDNQATQSEKTKLIKTISEQSRTVYGDKLIDFMDKYDLVNLQSATIEQLREYCAKYCRENTQHQER